MAKLGAFIEFTGFDLARKDAIEQLRDAAVKIRAIGAENIVIGSDCGQTVNPLPTDCLVMIAQGLRAQGITERQINTMFKDSPARMLGLPPLEPRVEPRKARAQ
jgi:predicted metal-dependent phosphotriesterase family hydrolase